MRDAAGEMADGFHFLRLDQSFPGSLQLFFRLLALGNVASYLGEADERPLRVLDRVDHDVRPELRAVLADTNALPLEPSFRARRLQSDFRQSCLAIFLRVEG